MLTEVTAISQHPDRVLRRPPVDFAPPVTAPTPSSRAPGRDRLDYELQMAAE